MKTKSCFFAVAFLASVWLPASADTVAYWRFEGGTAGVNVTHVSGANGVWSADIPDTSGNSNELSIFAEGWAGFSYQADLPAATVPHTGAANGLSVRNSGDYPASWTETGTTLQTWTPSAWTIEAAFKLETAGFRTIVGRDSRGSCTTDANLSALYFQITNTNQMAIKYCDVAGIWHEVLSAANAVVLNNWYAAAAVSDGSTLSLYLKDLTGGASAYTLIGSVDLTASADSRLTPGTGDGGDWDAGNFTVGRGLWNGGHTDRFLGWIDEVRISNTALTESAFLFTPVPDSDADGLEDLWEDLYFGNNDGTPSAGELALQDGTGDPDDDGYDNEAEETAGSNPTVKGSIPGDTDGDGLGDVWEKAYFGDLDEVGTGDPDTDGYTNEAEETAGSNPTDINSIPGDVDADDLADAWEQLYFGNLNETGAGDTDGDLATNEEEETADSNPASFDSWPDSDADGLNDAWEVANFTDLSKDGTADTDTDGFTDLEEFGANTDPADSAFSPAFAKGRHQWSFTNTLADSIGGSTAQIVPGGSANPAVLGATYVQMAGGAKDTSDYVLLGTNLLKGTSTPITIELWATQNTTQNWSRIFDFHASTSEKLYMSWTTGTDLNTDRVEWGDANGENVLVDSTNAPYSLLTKFHIVMVVEPGAGADGTTRVTWYSAQAAGTDLGAAQGTFDTTNNLVNLDDLNDALGLSPYNDNAPSATYDEVRIWNGALPEWAREALHDQGPDDMAQADADVDGLPDAWEASYPAFPAATSGATDDPDGDLTDNRHELLFGTDPTDPASNAEDTDADGLLDAWEIANFGAIASQDGYGDPDTDRATNEEEETAATDPNDDTSFPDTDGDGLCDGWEVYYFGSSGNRVGI